MIDEYDFYVLDTEDGETRIFKTSQQAYEFYYITYVNDLELPFHIKGRNYGEELG